MGNRGRIQCRKAKSRICCKNDREKDNVAKEEENRKRKVMEGYISRLVVLKHATKCKEAQCGIPGCKFFRVLWAHMCNCKDKECPVESHAIGQLPFV